MRSWRQTRYRHHHHHLQTLTTAVVGADAKGSKEIAVAALPDAVDAVEMRHRQTRKRLDGRQRLVEHLVWLRLLLRLCLSNGGGGGGGGDDDGLQGDPPDRLLVWGRLQPLMVPRNEVTASTKDAMGTV